MAETLGTPWEERIKNRFGFSQPEKTEHENPDEAAGVEKEAAPEPEPKDQRRVEFDKKPDPEPSEREEAPVDKSGKQERDAAPEPAPEPDPAPKPSIDPNIQALIEQNKQLTEMIRTQHGDKAGDAAEEADGLTADALMDPEVRKDPEKFAQVINNAIEKKAAKLARAEVDTVRQAQDMEKFRNEFYQRPENKAFVHLRDTALDPLNIAAQQALGENPALRGASKDVLMQELTRRVGEMGSLLDHHAKSAGGGAPARKRVNQPGAKPSTTHAGPAQEESIRGTRQDPDRSKAGIAEFLQYRNNR